MKKSGLFIGIDQYQNGVAPLKCAVNDSLALKEEFQKAGFDVTVLNNEEAVSASIIQCIREKIKTLETGDIFVFYFAGHGRENGGSHYLVAQDGYANAALTFGTLAMPELVEFTNKPGVNRLFILDCCRNNLLANARSGDCRCANSRDIALNQAVMQNEDCSIIPPLILNSCSTGQQAFEDPKSKHGFFTKALLQLILNQEIRSFYHFQKNLIIRGTPARQTVSWNGNPNHWNGINLFPQWDSPEIPKEEIVTLPPVSMSVQEKKIRQKPLSFFATIKAKYQGRASRKEYWAFQLRWWLFALIAYSISCWGISFVWNVPVSGRLCYGLWSFSVVLLFTLDSWTSVAIRRLHDGGWAGSWLWLVLIPVVGWFLLFRALNEQSEQEENHYGKTSEFRWKKWNSPFLYILLLAVFAILPSTRFYTLWVGSRLGMVENLKIPHGIPGSALYRSFDDCDSLRYVTIPKGVRVIPYGAFYGCDNLKYVYIPDSVRYIEEKAFVGCKALEEVTVPRNCELDGNRYYNYVFNGYCFVRRR